MTTDRDLLNLKSSLTPEEKAFKDKIDWWMDVIEYPTMKIGRLYAIFDQYMEEREAIWPSGSEQ